MLTGEPREHIARLWPEHLEHLAPEGNSMGQGSIDPEEGVVCNCGRVLGFPVVQDEEEYVSGDEPDGYVGDERETEPEHHYDPTSIALGDPDTALMPCELNPVPHSAVEHAREERTEARVLRSLAPDLYREPADEAQAAPAVQPDSPPGRPPADIPERDRGVVQAEDPITARVVVIDPTLPYGPMDVEHQLLDINARIERGVHFQRQWEEELFSAKTAYELANARAIVEAEGAADVRKASALLACEPEYRRLQLAETMVRAVRETMHNLRSLQSGYQTVARSVAESMRVPNSRP